MIPETTAARRRSLRLRGYDYAQAGAYFVTICVQGRACLFGAIAEGSMCLNVAGELAADLWSRLPARYPDIDLDQFVIMPNHIHGIVVLPDGAPSDESGAATRAAPTIGGIVGAFKSLFAVEYIRGVKERRWPGFDRRLWQRNYFEHVIRDETDLARVRRYIDENPLRWADDQENPERS